MRRRGPKSIFSSPSPFPSPFPPLRASYTYACACLRPFSLPFHGGCGERRADSGSPRRGAGARATKRGYFERGLLSVDPPRLSPPLSAAAAAAAAAFLRASCVLTCGVGGKKEGIDGNDAWEEGEAPAPEKAEDKKQDLPHVGISSSLLLLFFPIMNTVLN